MRHRGANGLARRFGARRLGHTAGALGVELPDGTFTSLATLDGRCLPTEVAGVFLGRVIGLHAAQDVHHCDWYGYEPLTS
ncbi:hypothetical protein [Streptomyces cyaneus]|uniref:hypothetical protein n=1 Tax=Streptomyces cyaneus TaxID=1904 RepID=UPI000FF892D8